MWYTDPARMGFYLQVWKMKGEKKLLVKKDLIFPFWDCKISINMRNYIRFLEWFLYFLPWGQISKVKEQCMQDNWSWQGGTGDFHSGARTLTPRAGWQQVPVPRMCREVCVHERPQKICQRARGVDRPSFPHCPRRTVSVGAFLCLLVRSSAGAQVTPGSCAGRVHGLQPRCHLQRNKCFGKCMTL